MACNNNIYNEGWLQVKEDRKVHKNLFTVKDYF